MDPKILEKIELVDQPDLRELFLLRHKDLEQVLNN